MDTTAYLRTFFFFFYKISLTQDCIIWYDLVQQLGSMCHDCSSWAVCVMIAAAGHAVCVMIAAARQYVS